MTRGRRSHTWHLSFRSGSLFPVPGYRAPREADAFVVNAGRDPRTSATRPP